ncbi:MAG TPA: hypothetical protein VM451_02975 [Candidatus Limnocylindria bacterium]|nr:hypothetical protein [Candidatus Limnocylindria bacterium]
MLIVNPRSDEAFVALAQALIERGAESPSALETELRQRYPLAVVRERGLTAEAPVWYVYREGQWIPSAS